MFVKVGTSGVNKLKIVWTKKKKKKKKKSSGLDAPQKEDKRVFLGRVTRQGLCISRSPLSQGRAGGLGFQQGCEAPKPPLSFTASATPMGPGDQRLLLPFGALLPSPLQS